MKSGKLRGCLMLLTVCLLVAGMPRQVLAAAGTVIVNLSSEEAGVTLQAYKVADYSKGSYKLSTGFEQAGIDLLDIDTAKKKEAAIAAFTACIETYSITGTKAQAAADGRVTFSFPEDGVYLIVQQSDFDKISIQSMLVSLPCYSEEQGELQHTIVVQPKIGTPDIIIPDEDRIPEGEPEYPQETPEQDKVPTTSAKPQSTTPQTDDTLHLMMWVGLAIVAVSVIGGVTIRKRMDKNEKNKENSK